MKKYNNKPIVIIGEPAQKSKAKMNEQKYDFAKVIAEFAIEAARTELAEKACPLLRLMETK